MVELENAHGESRFPSKAQRQKIAPVFMPFVSSRIGGQLAQLVIIIRTPQSEFFKMHIRSCWFHLRKYDDIPYGLVRVS